MTLLPMDALFASFLMQTALASVFVIAVWGIAFVYRRPLHRALAIGWTIYLGHTAASLVSAWLGRVDPLSTLRASTASLQLLSVMGSAAYWLAAIDILASRRSPEIAAPHPSPRVLMVLGTVSVALLAASLVSGRVLHQPGSGPLGWWYPSLYIVMAGLAWRFSGTQPSHQRESRWMAVMFALFAARLLLVTLVLLPESQFGTATMPQLLSVALVQVTQVATAAVISIAVAVSYEKAAVVAQTAQLYESEIALQRGQRLATLGRMAAGIAHDFNNVLLVVSGSVETAEAVLESPEEARTELREAMAAVRQGMNLTARLVSIVRPQESRSRDSRATVDTVVRECSPVLTRAVGPDRTLRIEPSADGVTTPIDPTEIEQLMLNLVVNARDATPAGGMITLRTALEEVDQPRRVHDGTLASGRYVRLSVDDNGTGIPADVLPHILDPFFSTKRETGGSGIGLATVSQIVVAAGGHIDVKSSLGNGTRFDLFLPVAV